MIMNLWRKVGTPNPNMNDIIGDYSEINDALDEEDDDRSSLRETDFLEIRLPGNNTNDAGFPTRIPTEVVVDAHIVNTSDDEYVEEYKEDYIDIEVESDKKPSAINSIDESPFL
jgi:hypothetical protein